MLLALLALLSFLRSFSESNLFALWFSWHHQLSNGIKNYFELRVIFPFKIAELTR